MLATPLPRTRRRVLPFVVAGGILTAFWALSALTPMTPKTQATEHDRHLAEHYTLHTQALYTAEAGIDEARARLRPVAGVHRILDTTPDDPAWGVLIGAPPDGPLADLSQHRYTHVASVHPALGSTVLLRHATHTGDGAVLRWGDAQGTGVPSRNTTHGAPIYVLTAHGSVGQTNHTVEVEAIHEAPPTVPAALYTGGPLRIASAQTHLDGMDSCGTQHQAGVQTPLATPLEFPQDLQLAGTSAVRTQPAPLQVHHMVATLKPRAVSFKKAQASWGLVSAEVPEEAPPTCATLPVVYDDTRTTAGRLMADTAGCGLLLIEGDVEISSAFTWYGPVLITGSLRLTDYSRMHVTGGVVVGGAVTIEAGAQTEIHYCSTAIAQPTQTLPLRMLSWRTVLPAT